MAQSLPHGHPSLRNRRNNGTESPVCVREWDDCFGAVHGSAFPFLAIDLGLDALNWHLPSVGLIYWQNALWGGHVHPSPASPQNESRLKAGGNACSKTLVAPSQ